MDSIFKILKIKETFFKYDDRIINLLERHEIKYRIDRFIHVNNKSFAVNVFLNGNNEAFVELSDIAKSQNYIYFSNSKSQYYKFLKRNTDLSQLQNDHWQYLMYRLDDNVEIVDAVLSKLDKMPYSFYHALVNYAINFDNINIFKYICTSYSIQISSFYSLKERVLRSECNIQFLDYLLSNNALSEIDIINGVKIIHSKDKIELALSYVDSGCLKLSEDTIRLLNEYINKN
jgi:hypothetical protein